VQLPIFADGIADPLFKPRGGGLLYTPALLFLPSKFFLKRRAGERGLSALGELGRTDEPEDAEHEQVRGNRD
jgi:hypothetical protein